MNEPEPMKVEVEEVKNGMAVLKFSDGQKIKVSQHHLPTHNKGDLLKINFGQTETKPILENERAKEILNKILKPDD